MNTIAHCRNHIASTRNAPVVSGWGVLGRMQYMKMKRYKFNNNNNLYVYPEFKCRYGDFYVFRINGGGIANNLFVWAKYVVFSKKYNAVKISPTWLQFNITKSHSIEQLKRHNIGLFKNRNDTIGGLKKIRKLLTLPRVSLETFEKSIQSSGRSINDYPDTIVTVSWIYDFFDYIKKEHAYIKKELCDIVHNKHKKGLQFDFRNSISVHIRLGDFQDDNSDTVNKRIEVSWYGAVLKRIRSLAGRNIPAYVFSDGADGELQEILCLPNVRRLSFGSSIADLLALSKSHLLIASGSTFSMWASYLGRMPVVWRHGKLKNKLYYDREHYEIECTPGNDMTEQDRMTIRQSFA